MLFGRILDSIEINVKKNEPSSDILRMSPLDPSGHARDSSQDLEPLFRISIFGTAIGHRSTIITGVSCLFLIVIAISKLTI